MGEGPHEPPGMIADVEIERGLEPVQAFKDQTQREKNDQQPPAKAKVAQAEGAQVTWPSRFARRGDLAGDHSCRSMERLLRCWISLTIVLLSRVPSLAIRSSRPVRLVVLVVPRCFCHRLRSSCAAWRRAAAG